MWVTHKKKDLNGTSCSGSFYYHGMSGSVPDKMILSMFVFSLHNKCYNYHISLLY